MTKILLISNILGRGGAERTVQTIARNVDRAAFDITVLCLESGGERADALLREGVRVLVGDGTIERVRELVRPGEYDIVHFHRSGHMEPLHVAVVEYLNPPRLMETNVFAFSDPILGPRFDLRVYKSMMMLTERAWVGEKLDRGSPWLKERVIYNPVMVDSFASFELSPAERASRRAALGIAEHDFVIGRVGRNDPVKWGDLLLAALPRIFTAMPDAKCIAHTAPDTRWTWLRKRGFFGGRVIVLPETGDERALAETYQLLDLYVHASRRGEAFGNSLNEAMVWGKPIVVENTPHWDNGQVEQVENGSTGWVVRSAGGLVAAVLDLARDERRRRAFGVAGRRKVEADFGLRRGIAQYELAYQQLSGRATSEEVGERMFPSSADIMGHRQRYAYLRRIDFPHPFSLCDVLHEWWTRAYWRTHDSLTARGILSRKA